ncbi:hypothetical protein PAHAL_7G260400 [Panicum hallii]|uniref:Uncharacterized protein n=1 Tax=Panicum hallii TaxID=206008 RepID=A0A2S3IA39_9POAL|nr:hypothetical protein PAHAL_7G260400 [Panicum hallii]
MVSENPGHTTDRPRRHARIQVPRRRGPGRISRTRHANASPPQPQVFGADSTCLFFLPRLRLRLRLPTLRSASINTTLPAGLLPARLLSCPAARQQAAACAIAHLRPAAAVLPPPRICPRPRKSPCASSHIRVSDLCSLALRACHLPADAHQKVLGCRFGASVQAVCRSCLLMFI